MSWLNEFLGGIPVNAVLRERLAQAQEQLVAAEKKIAALEAQCLVLQTENAALKVQLQNQGEEIQRLRNPPEGVPRWGSNPRIKGRMEL